MGIGIAFADRAADLLQGLGGLAFVFRELRKEMVRVGRRFAADAYKSGEQCTCLGGLICIDQCHSQCETRIGAQSVFLFRKQADPFITTDPTEFDRTRNFTLIELAREDKLSGNRKPFVFGDERFGFRDPPEGSVIPCRPVLAGFFDAALLEGSEVFRVVGSGRCTLRAAERFGPTDALACFEDAGVWLCWQQAALDLGIRHPVGLGEQLPESLVHALTAKRPEFAALADAAVGAVHEAPALFFIRVTHEVGSSVGQITRDHFVLVQPLRPIDSMHHRPLVKLITLAKHRMMQKIARRHHHTVAPLLRHRDAGPPIQARLILAGVVGDGHARDQRAFFQREDDFPTAAEELVEGAHHDCLAAIGERHLARLNRRDAMHIVAVAEGIELDAANTPGPGERKVGERKTRWRPEELAVELFVEDLHHPTGDRGHHRHPRKLILQAHHRKFLHLKVAGIIHRLLVRKRRCPEVAVDRLQMLRHARCGVIRKHFLVVIDARRGQAPALSVGTKVERLGGLFNGHIKGRIQKSKIVASGVSSIEKFKIKLQFLNLDTQPNLQKKLRLHNQNRAAARLETWEGPSSSHDPLFSCEAASEGSMTVPVVQAQGVILAFWRRGVWLSFHTFRVYIWAMPEVRPSHWSATAQGVFRTTMRWRRQCLSQSRRLCSPLSPTARQRDSKHWEGPSSSHDPNFSRKAASS